MNFAHPLPFGAEPITPQRTRFRWWAPDLEHATLEFERASKASLDSLSPALAERSSTGKTSDEKIFAEKPSIEKLPMRRCEDGWFECEADAGAGSRYRYRVNDELAVPDPASRQQSGDVHDWSVVVDARAFEWRAHAWRGRPWNEIVIYELHVGCCGGFRGVENKLREIAELGVTAVELMPLADFGGRRNWGYDGVLPFAPAAAYGAPHELKQLIDCAHSLGLCVYLDVVYNHFGPDGNYLPQYASAFFDAHRTSPWGAAIDFSRSAVRDFFIQNALYWLREYRFDGLRIDAAHAIDDPAFLDEMAARVRAAVEPDRHVHLMLENENNHAEHLRKDFNAQWNDDWHNALHVLLTGEREGYYANYEQPAQQFARALAEGFIYQGEPFPTREYEPRGTPSADLAPTAFINFLQNHDQIGNRAFGERLTTLVAPDVLRAAAALLLLSPNIPLLFMGEEFGARNPFLFFTDFKAELADAVRAGRRQEFSVFAAFRDASQRERIPDPNAPETFESSIPVENDTRGSGTSEDDSDGDDKSNDTTKARSLRAYYRRLLQLRREHIVPRLATCRSGGAHALSDKAIVAQWHFGDAAALTIAANFGDSEAAIEALAPTSLLFEFPEGSHARARLGKLAPRCAVATLQ